MIYRKNDTVAVGTRFRMSELGAARCPGLANRSGIVVEVGRRTTGITVLFDGARGAGQSKDWIKVKNRTHPAMTRAADAFK